jgi:hypothetical protein
MSCYRDPARELNKTDGQHLRITPPLYSPSVAMTSRSKELIDIKSEELKRIIKEKVEIGGASIQSVSGCRMHRNLERLKIS